MNATNDTNMTISGRGTAADPYIYNFHPKDQPSYETPWMFYIVILIILGLTAAAGFVLGFYFGKRRNKPN